MVLEELPKCKAPTEYNPYMGQPIPPLDRLKIMSEDDFEDLVVEWANGYVHNNYYKVSSMAGAGDKGRDVVAYYDDKTVDIYQCKHYKNPLNFAIIHIKIYIVFQRSIILLQVMELDQIYVI